MPLARFRPALALAGVLVVTAVATPVAAQTTYTFTGAEPTSAERLFRDGNPSDYLSPKAFPGTVGGGPFLYQTFTFVNTIGSANPFFVTPISSTGPSALEANVFYSAYLGSFDPTNLATNYLGDSGSSGCDASLGCATEASPFSVLAPGNASIVVVVNRVNAGTGPGGTFSFSAQFGNVSTAPEPGTYVLLGAGLLGVAGVARRRKVSVG